MDTISNINVTDTNIAIKKPRVSMQLNDREETLLESLQEFFSKMEYIEIMKPIIEGESISLRVLDWFVTNYSKKYNASYPIYQKATRTINGKEKIVAREKNFDVWTEYKSQLKLFSKELFDPFCRLQHNTAPPPKKKRAKNKSRELLRFYYDTGEDDYMETTLGQLNFFRWVISNKILEYIDEHLEEIENDMIDTHKEKKKPRASSKEKGGKGVRLTVGTRKQKAVISAARTFTKKETKIIVSFD